MTIPSPDGQYKASVFVDMGGGAGTYYCGTTVYVAASGVSDAAVKDDGDRVYSASCGGLREGHWEQNIRWKSSSELQIAFDPLYAVEGDIEGAAIKGYAVRGKVQVTYVFQKNLGDNW